MRRRKKKFYLFFILTLISFFSIFAFILFFHFPVIIIEPEKLSSLFIPYFENKSPLEIFFILKEIMVTSPEIIKISLYLNPFKQSLKIKIETSKIVAQICDFKNCFYLDNYSRIILPKIPPPNNLLKIISFLPLEKNSLLNSKIKNFLSLILEYANWKPLFLKEIKIYSNFDIGVIDGRNREFLFDPNRNLEEQIKKLHLFSIKNFKGSRIDLRIPQKIYFR